MNPRISSLRAPIVIAVVAGCAAPPAAPEPQVDEAWLADVSTRIALDPYQLQDDARGFRFWNPAQGLRAETVGDSFVIAPRSGGAPTTVRTRVINGRVAVGHPETGACVPGGLADVTGACLRRLDFARGGDREWWANTESGLEHGWTLATGPADRSTIVVDIGGAEVVVDSDGHGASFVSADGELRYAGLVAFDAVGDALPARMAAASGGLSIEIDTHGARFPVTVDPVVTAVGASREADSNTANLGAAVAGQAMSTATASPTSSSAPRAGMTRNRTRGACSSIWARARPE